MDNSAVALLKTASIFLKPDLVLADISLPGKNRLELIKDFQALQSIARTSGENKIEIGVGIDPFCHALVEIATRKPKPACANLSISISNAAARTSCEFEIKSWRQIEKAGARNVKPSSIFVGRKKVAGKRRLMSGNFCDAKKRPLWNKAWLKC
jgi:hypothetical protein